MDTQTKELIEYSLVSLVVIGVPFSYFANLYFNDKTSNNRRNYLHNDDASRLLKISRAYLYSPIRNELHEQTVEAPNSGNSQSISDLV